ncbi:stalk domain-containing protein [Pelotomaculum propionicicum]|uniref:stalk domain-containing protein n=1 Tax=Pelotomaculum propionicicum TaxID=258475 RepID=UPI003B7721FD
MKKFRTLVLSILLSFAVATAAYAAPQVILDGQQLSFDVPPVIENGSTLVPLRVIFEALGADVQWDGNTQTVTATKSGNEIRLMIGGAAYKNGQEVQLSVPAKIIEGRTLVPLRFVSEAFGCQVAWDGTTQTITITSISGTGTIKVHFIDVGQADAIYISLPDHNDILIDAGNPSDGPTVINYLKNNGMDEDLELVIATHPHADHIGGLPPIYYAFNVIKTIDSGMYADTSMYENYLYLSQNEGKYWEVDNYQTFTFGSVVLQIMTGPGSWDNVNDYSVVCRLDTGDIEFLFMGDAGFPAESVLSGELDAEILKVGHHGSRTSTSAAFLSKVSPEVAVISVGTGNTYGHPTLETLQRLQNAGATVYRTDLNGNIVITTDGKTYNTAISKTSTADTPANNYKTQVTPAQTPATTGAYVGSIKSNKYHYPSCRYAKTILPKNQIWFADAAEAQAAGYVPCGGCKP